MWTFQANPPVPRDGQVIVDVVYVSDANEIVLKSYAPASREHLKALIRGELDRLTAADTLLADLSVAVTDLTPAVPSKDDYDRAKYFTLRKHFDSQVQPLIDKGVLAKDDLDVVAELDAINTLFKKEYIGLGGVSDVTAVVNASE